ncbi:MAG: hypothetical protein ABFS43_00860 [Thermodesulfobacteriota bacterium]
MKFFSRRYFKIFIVYVGIIFSLSLVQWVGTGAFLKSTLAESSDITIGFYKDNPGIGKAIEVQNRYKAQLIGIPGVVGIGTGIGPNGHAVIRVFTRRTGLPGIPEKLDDMPVHVKVTGDFIALDDPAARFDRPVPIGVSTGHPDITAGTLGARVIDGDGDVYALSNNHVYANINSASLGDPALQPGSYDDGVYPDDQIGELCGFNPIDFSVFGSNTMDAAIACTTPNEVGNATLMGGYGMPSSQIFNDSDPVDGVFDNLNTLLLQPVQKFGRTTGLTHGEITEINVTTMVCYAYCDNILFAEYAWFDDQIAISSVTSDAFSLGGDSGSLVVTDDSYNNPVGLLFAGSSTTTLANRIDLVLNQFEVSIDGSQPTVPGDEICNNGTDDDSDDLIDCEDSDCFEDPACLNTESGNLCFDKEDNDQDLAIDCYDTDCKDECATEYCFKGIADENCNPQKDGPLCPDCLGTTQPDTEIECGNNIDDDADDLTDCDDPDCFSSPNCDDCQPKGSFCDMDGDCCSGKCRGGKCR